MAIKDTATDFELPQDNQIIFEDASVADIENMLEGEVELLPIQADTKVSRLPTVETVEMLAEEVPLKPIKAEEITIPQPAASAVSAKMLLGLSALLGGGAVLAAAGKSSGGGESKKQPVSEKNVPQQDDRENNGDKAERPSENNPVHNNDQTAPARPKPDEAAGSKVTPPETPPVAEKTQITTHIYYPNGASASITSSEDMAFDTASLEYSVAAEQTETKAGGRHLSLPNTGAEVITLNPDKVASSIYGRDTDKDGLIDVIDRAPKEWNVSERDLRMFASLAYEDKETLEALFRGKHEDGSKYISQKELVNYADVSELTGKWELLKAESPGSGLDYAVFGNRNEKGELDSVVVAFRGTQLFSLSDIWADLKILFANTPTQATYLNDIAQFIDSLNPKNVYSTGHSLGGYLAEYFAAHTMQQKYDWSVNFQHSSLFNPAILKIDNNSSDNLKNARYMAESFTKTPVIDKSDITQDKQLYKTNSYVIKGEWVSSGNWPFSGLGEYNNTISFDFKQSDWWGKHSMSSFYEKDATGKLEKYFSYGSRIDSHYNNPYKTDTDRDGFSDGIEAKLKSDPQDADSTPFAVTEPAMASDEGMGLAIVQTEKADGSVVSVKGVEMTGTQEEGNTVYRPSENPVVDLGTEKIQSAADGVHQAVITVKGTAGDDTIVGSKGNDIIWGGLGSDTIKGNGGSDTIVFSAEDIRAGKVDTVTDFGRDDFLDLGRLRTLFSDHPENFKWENILDNTDISSSALVYKADEHTLAYRAAGSENANVFARFDEQAEVSASQFIG
ncbi:TPA: Mbeg1-like protein [Neisseria oralis]